MTLSLIQYIPALVIADAIRCGRGRRFNYLITTFLPLMMLMPFFGVVIFCPKRL